MTLRFSGMPTAIALALRRGAPDANGLPAERQMSDGGGIPCRHCLGWVEAGAEYLVLAYRPFPALQPYAETGPVFIHADDCPAYDPARGLPPRESGKAGQQILRGYGHDDRIVYGTGTVVHAGEIEAKAASLLSRPDVAYLHMRSATNNCFTLRIDRGE